MSCCSDPALAKQIYGHPLICGLYRGKYRSGARNLPSYLPPSSFALALLDLVARGPVSESAAPAAAGGGDADARLPAATPSPISIDAVRRNLSTVPPPVRRVLEIALDAAEGDLARLQASVEAWFNSSMDRVSGWYKRHARSLHPRDWRVPDGCAQRQHRHPGPLPVARAGRAGRAGAAGRSGRARYDDLAAKELRGRERQPAVARAADRLGPRPLAEPADVVRRLARHHPRDQPRRAVLVRHAEQGRGRPLGGEVGQQAEGRFSGRRLAAADVGDPAAVGLRLWVLRRRSSRTSGQPAMRREGRI